MFSGIVWILFFIPKIYVGFVNIQKKQKEILAKIDLTAFKFFHIIKLIWHIIYANIKKHAFVLPPVLFYKRTA